MRVFILLLNIVLALVGYGQEMNGFKTRLEILKREIHYNEIDSFYQLCNYSYYWNADSARVRKLLVLLKNSEAFGLDEIDYQVKFVRSYLANPSLNRAEDSMETEIRFTDAAIHFFSDIKTGNKGPSLGYDGLKYIPDAGNIYFLLKSYMDDDRLMDLVQFLQPRSAEFAEISKKLAWFLKIVKDGNFKEVKVVSNKISASNKPLIVRLYQLGVIDSVNHLITDKVLRQKLKEGLKIFDVLNDGNLRSTGLEVLNKPLKGRVAELKYALNYLRWLEQIRQASTVFLLNIPSATAYVYENGKLIWESNVIVGKKSTPTPTLSSMITEVVLYPYWTVPYKIATRELLPSIKKNIDFLRLGNFQVINKEGRVLNPSSINWNGLNSGYFPYIIRQSTGCDNALGIVKFNFSNPFSVYLHDTPHKWLFNFNKRYFSHGCMRLQNPEELAHLVLLNNRIAIDTLTAKGCIYQQSPIVVPVEKKLPVFVIYSTVWYNKEGEIKFYDDIYKRF